MNGAWLRGARVWRALSAARTRARRVTAGSRTLRAVTGTASRLGRVITGDSGPEQTAAADRASSSAVSNSRLVGWLARLWGPVTRAWRGSGLNRLLANGRAYARGSFLYRWLTAEPEPDVIVIDLRETLTVGPWLRVLERAIAWLLPAAVASRLFRAGRLTARRVRRRPLGVLGYGLIGLAGLLVAATGATGRLSRALAIVALALALIGGLCTRVDLSLAELQETRPYRALATAFTPPEPPDSGESATGERERDRTDRGEETRDGQAEREPEPGDDARP